MVAPEPPGDHGPGEGSLTVEEFFDPSFLSELESLAGVHAALQSPVSISSSLSERLDRFLAGPSGKRVRLSEAEFIGAPPAAVTQRAGMLLEICREAGTSDAVRSVESFIVFFQALVPTLPGESAPEVRRLFFRLAPILIQIAFNDFSDEEARRIEGRAALANLEKVLLEIASVRLTPGSGERTRADWGLGPWSRRLTGMSFNFASGA